VDRRKVLVLVAALIAALGTAVVFLYVRGADGRADQKFAAQQVLVAKSAIAPGETLTAAQAAGKIVPKTVTAGSLVPGSVTDLASIPGKEVATTTIYPGEQILASKFGTSGSGASTLGIPKDQIAISIQLDDPGRVAGFVNPGDHVVIFASASADGGSGKAGGTQVLLPNVTVIGVGSTTTVATTTTDATGAQTTESLPRTLMTLALDQKDAQKVIFAKNGGSTLTFGLRSSTSQIAAMPPTNLSNLFN
jgi:pilus assembly protein CpaB